MNSAAMCGCDPHEYESCWRCQGTPYGKAQPVGCECGHGTACHAGVLGEPLRFCFDYGGEQCARYRPRPDDSVNGEDHREEFGDQASALAEQIASGVAGAVMGPLHTAYVRGIITAEADARGAKRRIAAVLDALRQWGDHLTPEQVRALRRALEGSDERPR